MKDEEEVESIKIESLDENVEGLTNISVSEIDNKEFNDELRSIDNVKYKVDGPYSALYDVSGNEEYFHNLKGW